MNKLTLLLIVTMGLILFSCGKEDTEPDPNPNLNTFTDTRDDQSYRWVLLEDGNKWMAENLNYESSDSWCYDDVESNCNTFGRLYTWDAALTACPTGWHLPSNDEWQVMAEKYGGHAEDSDDEGMEAYNTLIQGGSSGFDALLGGGRISDGSYLALNEYSVYWSSTEQNSEDAWEYNFYKPDSNMNRNSDPKTFSFSCRCVQD